MASRSAASLSGGTSRNGTARSSHHLAKALSIIFAIIAGRPTLRTAGTRVMIAGVMGIELTEKDFLPLEQCQFQHWGDHGGPPYTSIRPLSESAAERVWRRT